MVVIIAAIAGTTASPSTLSGWFYEGGRYLPNVAVLLIAQHRAGVALKDVRGTAALRNQPRQAGRKKEEHKGYLHADVPLADDHTRIKHTIENRTLYCYNTI